MSMAWNQPEEVPQQFTGHRVLDETGDVVGKVSDVIYDRFGNDVRWLVVDVGLFGTGHYAPAADTFLSDSGDLVVPCRKDQIKHAPKAHRDHVLTEELDAELRQHYALA